MKRSVSLRVAAPEHPCDGQAQIVAADPTVNATAEMVKGSHVPVEEA